MQHATENLKQYYTKKFQDAKWAHCVKPDRPLKCLPMMPQLLQMMNDQAVKNEVQMDTNLWNHITTILDMTLTSMMLKKNLIIFHSAPKNIHIFFSEFHAMFPTFLWQFGVFLKNIRYLCGFIFSKFNFLDQNFSIKFPTFEINS